MKSVINDVKLVEKAKFPKLMIDPNDGCVIIATEYFEDISGYSGICIKGANDACDVGEYRDGYDRAFGKSFFIDFEGSITLSN